MPDGRGTYPPLNTLKPVAEDVWIVDGPLIRFGLPSAGGERAQEMRRGEYQQGLFIHSPTELVPELKSEIERAGTPRWIVGPNRIHYWWIPDWRAAFPAAGVYLAPGIREQAGSRIEFDGLPLLTTSGYAWDKEIATLPVSGSFMTEVVFFHRPSRTLILTDLIENFELEKLASAFQRWLTWIGGAQDPNGSMPRDMRLTYARDKPALKAAVERMIAWDPERIILAHGRWYERNGAMELRRAFQWLLA